LGKYHFDWADKVFRSLNVLDESFPAANPAASLSRNRP
jgi:hypothetical protein